MGFVVVTFIVGCFFGFGLGIAIVNDTCHFSVL